MSISIKKIDEIIERVNKGESIQKIIINEKISKEDYRSIRIRARKKRPIKKVKNFQVKKLKERKAMLEEQLRNISRFLKKIENSNLEIL